MKIFVEIKTLVAKEKYYTGEILNKLMIVEKDKLYCDLKYPSLHRYMQKELGYSEAEATIRVNAVRLMLKSQSAQEKIQNGILSLTNASEAQKALKKITEPIVIEEIVAVASQKKTNEFKEFVRTKLQQPRREVVILDEYTLTKFDRLKHIYGDLSSYEMIQILLEEKLKTPDAPIRVSHVIAKNSRYIPKAVKEKVYDGKCKNCGVKFNLEYDHKIKFSHGGDNSADNIQLLCRPCNLRKEIVAKQRSVYR